MGRNSDPSGQIPQFIQKDNIDMIALAVRYIDLPADCEVRTASFIDDLRDVSSLSISDSDRIHPCYGMETGDSTGDLTLILEVDGQVAGQISCVLMCDLQSQELLTSIDVSGIFICKEQRRRGLGRALSSAIISVAHAWQDRLSEQGYTFDHMTMEVSADTEPETVGDQLIDMMRKSCETEEDLCLST